jgi:hypothetical protein
MGKSKPPKPPNPAQTAAAQTGVNVGTAIAESKLNQVNQVTPDGNLTYSQTGTYEWKDPLTGKSYSIPQSTATTTLSPEQQRIKAQDDAASLNLASLANSQSGRLQGLLDRPVDLNNEAVESRLFELGSKRLRPELDRSRDSLETRLSNQGIKLGSTAFDRAMEGQSFKENDAWNNLALTGRSQALNELLTERNQPLNEISALLSGSAVQQPQFASVPQSQLPTTDYAGLVNQNYQAQLGNWQNQQAQRQSTIGGLFGLGAGLIGGF